jgi:hypothetical protein
MVLPEWPPMTGTLTLLTSSPFFSATNVLARTMSSVETPARAGPSQSMKGKELSLDDELEPLVWRNDKNQMPQ